MNNDSYRPECFLVQLNGKKGIYSGNGQVLLDVQYDDIVASNTNRYSDNGMYSNPAIVVKNGKYGMVAFREAASGENKTVVPYDYEELAYLNTFLVTAKNKASMVYGNCTRTKKCCLLSTSFYRRKTIR